jgi:hypothetical protein
MRPSSVIVTHLVLARDQSAASLPGGVSAVADSSRANDSVLK